MKIHIVQKGDTLWKIAKKYGVNFEELKKMNAQLSNPDMIMPGMKIKVPTAGGNIKKEAQVSPAQMIAKKEQPIAKEKQHVVPPVEAPIMVTPKEAPIAAIPKEVPKKQYAPKMPQPVIPEIDINNYYLMNMANLSVQQPTQSVQTPKPVQPKPIQPIESAKPTPKPIKPTQPQLPPLLP